MTNNVVNHPDHYNKHPSGVECIDIVRHMNFNIGNAIKYLWRAGLKSEHTKLEDLNKALWYVNDEIERLTLIANTANSVDENIGTTMNFTPLHENQV